MIRSKAVSLAALTTLLTLPAHANDGAPPYTFEGSPGPVLELNDQGKPAYQAEPEAARPAAPAPRRVATPASVATPAAAVTPAPVPAPVRAPAPAQAPVVSPVPAPVISQPVTPGAVLQPVQAPQPLQAPAIVTPVTAAPLQWENPPQGVPPFADPAPAPVTPPESARSCTREAFDRGLCVAR